MMLKEILGQAAAEDFIEARHAGGQLPNGHSILALTFSLLLSCGTHEFGLDS